MWKPAALFRRLVTASPIPPLSGHWAQMAETAVWSKARRASVSYTHLTLPTIRLV